MAMRVNRWSYPASTVRAATALALALATPLMTSPRACAQQAQGDSKAPVVGRPTSGNERSSKQPKLGVQLNSPKAFQGYTLIFPLQSTRTYLVDMQGRIVRTWESRYAAGQDAYLLPNGHLLRAAKLSENEAFFAGPAQGGRVQEFTWEGRLIWDYKFHNQKQLQHHAITPMPNGNVLLIVWERKTAKEALEAGVKPESVRDGEMLVDSLVEVKPRGMTGGEVVWEWHLWDHLIQDQDRSRRNYGDVAAHPELVDANFGRNMFPAFANLTQFFKPPPDKKGTKKGDSKDEALAKLKGIGYLGAGGGRKFEGFIPDWTHVNAVAYNAKFDQIMLSPREFSEVWIIDHSTTSAEAASHTGGKYGKGGDLLYRWGNPRAYRAGSAADQRLFSQHDTQWIADGLPGEGHLLVFNNGGGRPGNYSSVDEVVLPVGPDGRYEHKPGTAFGPDQPLWSYTASKKSDFFAPLMSGAQRLPNGNTLICTGFSGTVFEVTPEKEIVWDYINPARAAPGMGGPGGGPMKFRGPGPFAGNPRSVQLLPGFLSFALRLSPEQRKNLEAYEKETTGKLEALLTDEQKKQLKDMQKNPGPFGPGGPGGPPEFGRILPSSVKDKLKLSVDQMTQMDKLQQEADGKMAEILKDEQKKQLKEMQQNMKAFAGPPPGFGPGGPGGPPGFGPGGPGGRAVFVFPGGGPGGMGGRGGGALFRAYRYGSAHPGLTGRDLAPGQTINEAEAKENKRLSP